MPRKYIYLTTGGLAALLFLLVGIWLLAPPYTFRGSLIDPPVVAADFSLSDQHGETFRLSDQRGKVVMMAFGYTHCPDVCPATLADFKRVRMLLGQQADQVQFVFVTVDPERDTPAYLARYMQAFDASFYGLSADRAVLEPVWQNYGVYQEKQFLGSAAGYLVDHTSRIYVIDNQGHLRLTFAFGTDVNDMVQDVRYLVGEKV